MKGTRVPSSHTVRFSHMLYSPKCHPFCSIQHRSKRGSFNKAMRKTGAQLSEISQQFQARGHDERPRSKMRNGSTAVLLLTVVRVDHNHRLILQIQPLNLIQHLPRAVVRNARS